MGARDRDAGVFDAVEILVDFVFGQLFRTPLAVGFVEDLNRIARGGLPAGDGVEDAARDRFVCTELHEPLLMKQTLLQPAKRPRAEHGDERIAFFCSNRKDAPRSPWALPGGAVIVVQ